MNFNEEIDKELSKMELDGHLVEINEKIESPSGSLVEQTVKMRQELTKTNYGIEELLRIYINTSIGDYFIKDNIGQCDIGSIQKGLKKVPHRKSKL